MRKNNDGSYNEDDINTLKDSIIKFLYVIRECNPNAYIIWCYGMLGNNMEQPIKEAVSEYANRASDDKAAYVSLPDTDETTVGSRQHPGELSHKHAADVLIEYIKTLA